ncbi:Cysteine-rich secretory protein family protein [Corynebacterium occultum]|uniref:Cysteine-rich secretory protein family protein n=1 Tax=Corynebacterium occultum TaxID=2675219 RepID=A0A6B8W683_9CORY|nr:CAP domain-containing protein [Corynebacterium occultum]QGU08091.1 Cysteine-rich secretory protein family protein [Corynebacterium occultum]
MKNTALVAVPLAVALLLGLNAAPASAAVPALLSSSASSSSEQTPRSQPSPSVALEAETELTAYEQELLDLTHAYRIENGVPPVKADDTLARQSRTWSRVMADDEIGGRPASNFQHNDRWNVAENIVVHNNPEVSPEVIVDMRINSPGHRANILNEDYTKCGFGTAISADDNIYVTQQLIW